MRSVTSGQRRYSNYSEILTGPTWSEIERMKRCGFSEYAAIKRLLRLGVLVRRVADLESDLIHGTHLVLLDEVERGSS